MSQWKEYLEKNKLGFGFLFGILSPTFLFAAMVVITDLLGSLSNQSADLEGIKIRTIFLVAICTNIFWIRYYNQSSYSRTLRGMVFATMILSILWFVRYYSELYGH